ncbi:MAG: hypothetical protein JNL11_03555 [Bdellovibrionaceae bacterium]|nr:hypothetical protein [Pseudobdellovibrionaceae bacterium]
MRRTLHFAIIVSLFNIGTFALAQSCIDWYSGKDYYDQMLATAPPADQHLILSLIKYQKEHAPVVVYTSLSRRISIQGKITNLHMENGKVLFNIGSFKVDLENIDAVFRTGILSNPEQMLDHVNPSIRKITHDLIRAQQEQKRVEISYLPHIGGRYRGNISSFRLEDGRLEFDFNGKPFTHGIANISDVRLLAVNKNPEYILASVHHEKKEIVQTLLRAQQENKAVEIKFTNGLSGKATGTISNVRIEDGYFLFDLNGHSESLFHVRQAQIFIAQKVSRSR